MRAGFLILAMICALIIVSRSWALITDPQLVGPYSGVGFCPAGQVVFGTLRNAAPSCVAVSTPGPTSTPSSAPTATFTPSPTPAPTPQHAGVGSCTDASGTILGWNVDAPPSCTTPTATSTPAPTSTSTPTPTPTATSTPVFASQWNAGSGTVIGNATATDYFPISAFYNATATEANIQMVSSQTLTLKNLRCRTGGNAGASNTFVFTVRDNTASPASGLTCTETGATNVCSDVTHTVSVTAGDLLDIQDAITIGGSAPGNTIHGCSVEVYLNQ